MNKPDRYKNALPSRQVTFPNQKRHALRSSTGVYRTCRWLATFSLVSPETPIKSNILFGTASAQRANINTKSTIQAAGTDDERQPVGARKRGAVAKQQESRHMKAQTKFLYNYSD
eukprot:4822416-Pyramimonas_sp.AAC.1